MFLIDAAGAHPRDDLAHAGVPPYGEQVIDDLTPEEADAFLDAVLS